MNKTIIGIFHDRGDAEEVVDTLKTQGFDAKDISIVMKDTTEAQAMRDNTGTNVTDGAVSGAATGAVVGGIAGLLAGIVLPGLGAFLIGGPIAATLGLGGAAATTVSGVATGAVAGGLLGALMGLGLTHDEAKNYETQVNDGAILLAVPVREEQEDAVQQVFDEYNASDVRTVDQQQQNVQRTTPQREYAYNENQYATMGAKGGETGHASKKSRKSHTGKKGGVSSNTSYANPVQVEKYLKGIDYPATKQDLLQKAEQEGADEKVMSTLEKLPDEEYEGPTHISRAIGNIK